MCIARWRKYCHVSTNMTATQNWNAGTMYQYNAFATKISQLAKAGRAAPDATSNPEDNNGYFPPASAAASIGCDTDIFFDMAAAFRPNRANSCGRAC